MITLENIHQLEMALVAPGSDIKRLLANYFTEHFPEFEILIDQPATVFGIQEDSYFDLVARAKHDSETGNAGDIALAVTVKEELDATELKSAYEHLAKLKSDTVLLQLHTTVLAKTSHETLESLGAALIEQNKAYPNGKWLDDVVVLGKGIINYGAHDPTTRTVGNFLHHNTFTDSAALPALYLKLMASATKQPFHALMYRVAATLLVAWPSKRHKEVHSLSETGLLALPLADYQYNLQGHLKPMPEDQYLDRKIPTFPIEIIVPGEKVVGHIEYLEWQDGGVLILRGEFPLDIILLLGGFGASRPLSITRKNDVQISCLLPLTKMQFNVLLHSIQGRSNFSFRSSRPPLVIQQVANEGVSVPLIARVRMGLLTLRDSVPKSSVNIDGYDRAIGLVHSNLMSAREGLKSIEEIYSKHLAGLTDGTAGTIEGNVIRISDAIDAPLRDAAEKFINNCGRVVKVGMKGVITALGENLDFFYKKDSTFRAGLATLAAADPALAAYLERCRNEWSNTIITLRNDSLEHGDGLISAATYNVTNGRIVILEPQIANRPLREFSAFVFDKLSKFVEELTVYLLQKKLTRGFKFDEVPLNRRDPSCATRFRLALSPDGNRWQITYTDTSFDLT